MLDERAPKNRPKLIEPLRSRSLTLPVLPRRSTQLAQLHATGLSLSLEAHASPSVRPLRPFWEVMQPCRDRCRSQKAGSAGAATDGKQYQDSGNRTVRERQESKDGLSPIAMTAGRFVSQPSQASLLHRPGSDSFLGPCPDPK
jgi:hypothetical protein